MLNKIQQDLHAPKDQENKFGGYSYRSAEDILKSVKPLLDGAELTLSDEIVEVGGRVYVKATAKLHRDGEVRETTAYAREPLSRKGMDESQITGAASSYARKYALAGLFAIDNEKDADTKDNRGAKVSAEEKLQAATNLKALGDAWDKLTLEEKTRCAALKDELKLRLEEI